MDPVYEADIAEHWVALLQTVICKEEKNLSIGAMTAVLHWLRQKWSIKIKFLNPFVNFPVKSESLKSLGAYFGETIKNVLIIWTTTPWTI